jgi:hypothetical protein
MEQELKYKLELHSSFYAPTAPNTSNKVSAVINQTPPIVSNRKTQPNLAYAKNMCLFLR